ncbi:MAG: hypothetical protein WC332_02415 [Clostridia bacterium]|jgi:hypothetical protein
MDGKSLTNGLAALLNETVSSSSFLESRVSYDYLYEAACEFVRRTRVLTASQEITTVADQTNYDLNADFLSLYLRDDKNRYTVKFNDGSNDYFIPFRDYESVTYSNNTTSVTIPSNFSIIDKSTLTDRITGSVTSDGASTNGECTCTDSSAPFTNVKVGDDIHNTTDGSDGVVIAVTSTSALVTTLFGGTDNDWDSSDAYIIVPQGRKQLVLDPPPSTAAYTVTIKYVQKPDPVYSPYRTYRFDRQYEPAIIKYAAWLYKMRDESPDFGHKYYMYWDSQVRMAAKVEHKSLNQPSMRINFIKKSYESKSYR